MVDFPTAILGIHNSESLKLITIHFDSIGAEMSQPDSELLQKTKQTTPMYVNAMQNDSDEFSIRIKELFTGIGNMNM